MPIRRLERPAPSEYNPRFDPEITLVPDAGDFPGLLRAQFEETSRFIADLGEENAAVRYAPEKWTVREVVGHMADVERVLSYRALRIARGDMTVLPGFDETAYVPSAQFEARTLASVMTEFRAVREATATLVEGLPDTAGATMGNVGSGQMSVRALLYLIAGHELHHLALFRERYLPHTSLASHAKV
ncbi:MAG TPA: DinB family protein [Gemmatimonadaceae bacterium]|jgi:uncharacterized damage-inducible protein DinB|nr:DinB family protein [Gemmatimonadaceae bacterium]